MQPQRLSASHPRAGAWAHHLGTTHIGASPGRAAQRLGASLGLREPAHHLAHRLGAPLGRITQAQHFGTSPGRAGASPGRGAPRRTWRAGASPCHGALGMRAWWAFEHAYGATGSKTTAGSRDAVAFLACSPPRTPCVLLVGVLSAVVRHRITRAVSIDARARASSIDGPSKIDDPEMGNLWTPDSGHP